MIAIAQLWYVSKQQNEIVNTLKKSRKPDAVYSTPNRYPSERPNNDPKRISNSTPEVFYVLHMMKTLSGWIKKWKTEVKVHWSSGSIIEAKAK